LLTAVLRKNKARRDTHIETYIYLSFITGFLPHISTEWLIVPKYEKDMKFYTLCYDQRLSHKTHSDVTHV